MSSNPLTQIQNNTRHGSKGGFKPTLNGDECRRSREETTIQIRKNRKDEMLRKRRNMVPIVGSVDALASSTSNQYAASNMGGMQPSEIQTIQTIAECVEVLQKWISSGKQIVVSHDNNDENDMNQSNDNSVIILQELIDNVQKLRRMLMSEKNPPVKYMLNAGVLFFFIEILDTAALQQHVQAANRISIDDTAIVLKQYSKLIFEVTWALTNIASTEHANSIVQYPNAIERLVTLLTYDLDASVREQSIWCLGNIAGDNIHYRDMLLKNERVKSGFLTNLALPETSSLLSNLCWAISNMVRKSSNGKNTSIEIGNTTVLLQPTIESTRCFIHPMYRVIRLSIDTYRQSVLLPTEMPKLALHEMISDAMWCMTYLSDGENSRIQVLLEDAKTFDEDEQYHMNKGDTIVMCIKDILEMHHNNSQFTIDRSLLIPAIRCLGNIASGTNEQTLMVVSTGVLKYIPDLLSFPSQALKKEICWMLSNIAAGTVDDIWAIFAAEKMNGLVRKLIRLASVRNDESMNVRKEALWTLSNIITTGNAEQHNIILKMGVIDPLCDLLLSTSYRHDTKLLLAVMEALEVILYKNEVNGTSYDRVIDEYEGVEALENLQDHPSNDVYMKAASILEKYFNGTAEDEQDIAFFTQSDNNNTVSMKFDFSSPSSGITDNLPFPPKQLFPTNNN